MITPTQKPMKGLNPCGMDLDAAIESHRSELTRYCRRKLGSHFDAEDAVQETLVRAWRSAGTLQQPAALRPWLYRIAGNVCVDSAKRRRREAVPTEDWSEPLDRPADLDPADLDPALLVFTREELRLALSAAMHHLPPRQWAVLLLREILCWRAVEVAEFLTTTVAAVNSALQRAHATLDASEPDRLAATDNDSRRRLVASYVRAVEADDVDALVALSGSRLLSSRLA
jgi:RNA polymerase sigma-70 factor, ECF subfamily